MIGTEKVSDFLLQIFIENVCIVDNSVTLKLFCASLNVVFSSFDFVFKTFKVVYTLEKSLPSSWWHGIFFEFARLKLVLLKGHIRREMFSEKILKFDAGIKKLQWFMPPSLSKC